jgi:C-terminal processing protease CtpA/Prc
MVSYTDERNAELKVGDEIVVVEGQLAEKMSKMELEKALRSDKLSVTVRRGNAMIPVRLWRR